MFDDILLGKYVWEQRLALQSDIGCGCGIQHMCTKAGTASLYIQNRHSLPFIFSPKIKSASQKLQDQKPKQRCKVYCAQQRRYQSSEQVQVRVSHLACQH